ncbi:SGNH/GDSL hydrolase family protein [Aeromicrobium sp. 9AM]|uniref:SGNH/GDSL hydrolase family protein n=1 Tax=Aeromicrobium sp. 9AM TaxID=2653126 RepID=UPI0012F0C14F|nr:SGNH/GDSL hydrolase family protein [Aeromicrobium sp. 9AM]VXC09256.1 hypothetical protein AERO9AM_50027 [Aeromicrobium sp. 9AM]
MSAPIRNGVSVPPLPTFQPRAGHFDPATGVYVPVGCRGLPKFNSDLAKVRTGSATARAQVALAGHSLMAGYTSSVGTYDPGSVLRKMLSQSLGVKAGSGLIPTFNGDAVGFTDDSRYSKSGTFIWLGSAGNLVPWAYGSTPNCSVTLTSNTPGTVVDMLVSDGFGNLTYTIDGSPGTITVGGTSAYKLVTVTGLADTNHTVTVTSAAGSEILVGVNVRYPSDLEVHDFGIVGTSAADWIGGYNYATSLGTIVGMAPSCVAIMLGHAEIQAGTSRATYTANMQSMISTLTAAGSDIILIGTIPLDTYSDAQWLPYREALYDLADTNNCLLVDPYPYFGTYAGGVALGLFNGVDIAHLTNAGNAELMRLVAGAFMQGTGSGDLALQKTANLSDVSDASAARTSLGLGTAATQASSAFQAADADLATIAGLTATTGNMILSVASAWASQTPAQVKTALALNNVDNTSDATKNSATATFTNKRVTKRISALASAATITILGDSTDLATVTALATNTTFAAPSGTPTHGQEIWLRIKDNGTARTLTWNATFRAMGVTLPTTTVISKTTYLQFMWNATDGRWDCLDVKQEA